MGREITTKRGVFATPPPYGSEAWAHDYARRRSVANPTAAYLVYRLLVGERNWRCSQTGACDPFRGKPPLYPASVRGVCEYFQGEIRIEWRGGLGEPQQRVDLALERAQKAQAEERATRRREARLARATAQAMAKVEAAAQQRVSQRVQQAQPRNGRGQFATALPLTPPPGSVELAQ